MRSKLDEIRTHLLKEFIESLIHSLKNDREGSLFSKKEIKIVINSGILEEYFKLTEKIHFLEGVINYRPDTSTVSEM